MRVNEDGHRQHFVFLEAHSTGRARLSATLTVIGPDGQPTESKQEHPIIRTLRALTQSRTVDDALRFLHKGDWSSLYKAYEIVRDETQGDQGIISRCRLTEATISLFRQTAQSREAVGDDARHASRKYKSPEKPMSIDEAKAVVGDLVQKWIDSMQQTS
jgi:hypothetical protein